MKKILLLELYLFLALTPSYTANRIELFENLEIALQQRNQYSQQKEMRIDSLKHLLYPSISDDERFHLHNAIYKEYYTYRFDSAIFYVDLEEETAIKLSNTTYYNLSIIHRSILLSTSGYFSESVQSLEQIDNRTLDDTLRIRYYAAYEWAYSMWAEYSNDKVYAPRYYEKEMLYQDSLINIPLSTFYQAIHRDIIIGKEKIFIAIANMQKQRFVIKRHWRNYLLMSDCMQ